MPRLLSSVLLLLAACLPLDAFAHAQLRQSQPAANAVLDTAPEMVVLRFNEPIAPLMLRWISPAGVETEVQGQAQDEALLVTPPAELAEGTHLLSWRVVSSDGHPVGGILAFSIGHASATEDGRPAAATAWPAALARFALTLTLVLAVGGAIFRHFVADGTASAPTGVRFARLAGLAILPAALAAIASQGLDMLGLPASALLTARPWQAGLDAPITVTAALAIIAGLLALPALSVVNGKAVPGAKVMAGAAWLLAAASFASSGHATVAEPRLLSTPAVAAHGFALVFWIGCLPYLLLAMRKERVLIALVHFSRMALPLVVLLLASGLGLAALQAGSPEALLASDYGRVLAAKLVLVAAMLALALFNRFRLTPALARKDAGTTVALKRSIGAEIMLGIAVLALASAFRLTPPPRALADQARPVLMHIHTDRVMADIEIAPGRVGANDFLLFFQTGDFQPFTPQAAEITLQRTDREIENIRVKLHPAEDGTWHSTAPAQLPWPGAWSMRIAVLVNDFEVVSLTETLVLEP